jgi:glycosyltransferase involved in cell wall biosynthesis
MPVAKRALWLMNHRTLRAFEVPLIEALGYEVFLPKSFPYDEGNLSASIDRSRDAALTIPAGDLDRLNRHDFYGGLTPEIGEIASRHFDIAFFGFFPAQLAGLVRHFRNTLVMRPFGLSAGVRYTDVVAATLGPAFLHELDRRRPQFWFGQAYDHLHEVESGIFRDRAVTLPLGLADAVVRDEWAGTDARVLFVCPRIETSPYFKRIYRDFLAGFGDLPHVIGGAQPIDVEDPNVTGFLERDAYDALMRRARAMFYHSREERHLHYHPLEAVRCGLPLVFMAGGLLDRLGGRDLPGRCANEGEARAKLARLLSGDDDLAARIRASQSVLLQPMSRAVCEPAWRRAFDRIAPHAAAGREPAPRAAAPHRKIAVILPERYKGGTLNLVKLHAKMLKRGSALAGRTTSVVFAHLDDDIYDERDFADLAAHGIERRPFRWKYVDAAQLADIHACSGHEVAVADGWYSLPKDGTTDLLDCDFWFVGTDRFNHPLAPLRPYCLVAQDYLQRYFPEVVPREREMAFLTVARNAVAVLATTPHALGDVVDYAGIPRTRALLVPHVAALDQFQDRDTDPPPRKQDYLLWTTNATPHKNHLMTFDALDRYYRVLGGRLDCVVTGVDTERLDPRREFESLSPHVLACRRHLERYPGLLDRIRFLGNVSQEEYVERMRGARFLLHNAIMDNGTLCSVEAAYASTPTLSSDYPPMRYISERYGINVRFFDAFDSRDLARRLKEMEAACDALRAALPDRRALLRLGWEEMAPALFAAVHGLMGDAG